jgi:hypothetical protein
VVLARAPNADPGGEGPLQLCSANQPACVTDGTQDTSRFNATGATQLGLPNCEFGIRRILIMNAGSSDAYADVECAARPQSAPLGGGLPTTAPGGGTH